MANSVENKSDGPKKVAVACQGGGMHAAFAVGVLTEILTDVKNGELELVGISGTSAGALCALIVGYNLAPKAAKDTRQAVAGSVDDAIKNLRSFWEDFVAKDSVEIALNQFTYRAFQAEEQEFLGINAPTFGTLNPYGLFYKAFAGSLSHIGVRKEYFGLMDCLEKACPRFDDVDWTHATTRVLIGASEVVQGFETVFDSDVDKQTQLQDTGKQKKSSYWRQRLPLTLSGVAASGTLPLLSKAQHIVGSGDYWDGLYSQNPPVREFFDPPLDGSAAGSEKRLNKRDHLPDELWIIRINPQQWPYVPEKNKDIQDRQNELMGNLSLNKELDFIMTVNEWIEKYKGKGFADDQKPVTVRTIKMNQDIADSLSCSSKINRSLTFMKQLRDEGEKVARHWLKYERTTSEYPKDAGYDMPKSNDR